jgi:hypothetical protein
MTRVHLEDSQNDWAGDLVITYTWTGDEWTATTAWDTVPGQGELVHGEWTDLVVAFFRPQPPVTANARKDHQTIYFGDDPVPVRAGEPVSLVDYYMKLARDIGYPGA